MLEEIRAVRATTAGEPTASDTFARTDYVAWTVYEYTDCCRLLAVLVYHDIPAAGEGLPWTNYACTTYGYDAVRRRNKTVTPGGTITRVVFDARGNVVQTWIGTNDNGATDADPTGDGASGNTMVLVSEREYDGGLPGYDGLLTEQVLYPSDTEFRQTFSAYDWRHRLVGTTGEEGFFEKRYYDNLGRVTKTERSDGSASGTLLARSETFYDDRGRVYRTVQHEVDPATGAIGASLADDIWFDAAGNVIKSLPSGAKLFTKSVYDGLGRATKRFDGYDLDETEYGDAVSVVDDTILWQIETAYDPEGKAISSASRHRYHEATGTGELSGPSGAQPKARINYAAAWFDPTGRRVAIARYGSNGGSALVRPASVATRTDTCLVSETFYHPAGRLYRTVDPSGREDRTEYDARGRRVTRIENYKDGAVSPVFPDEDRTTRWTYAPDGGVETLTAVNPDTGDQTTTYVYGTTRGDSGVARSDLKRAEIYPDSDDAASPLGNGPDGVYDRIEFRYDRLGAVIEVKDQNGTVHAYDYDGLGRVVQDRVTTVGTGIDGAVRRIETAYDSRGLRSRVTSYDNATVNSGTALNEVVAEYNGFVQLVREYQAVDGAVNMFTTPKVEYAYADGSTNTVRPIGLTYPSSRTINYGYGTVGSADDAASRVASITDSDPSSTQLVGYIYLGAGIVVEVDYPEPDLKYTLIGTAGGTDPNTGDVYLGLDRFGRIKDACWRDYGAGTVAVRLKYGYDRSGNRLWREDSVAVDHGKNFDELYAYDGLSRLTDMRRGRLNVDKMVLTTTTFVQDWNLDATGNWSRFREDADGDAVWDLVQNRTGSRANEIASISETAGPAWADPAYDQAGNMTTLPKPASPTATFTAVYDAWNRLVRLRDSATNQIVQENVYDGRQFQVVQKTYSSGTLAETRQFYHTADWQVIEERIGTAASAERQFVWGLRYIDELVLRDRNTGAHNSPDERLYALQDANWNVVALLDVSGSVLERYSYAPYGRSVALAGDYTTGTSAHDGRFLFASYRWEDSGIAVVRNRALAANVGWLQRDPLGTLVGRNLYEYVDGNPIRATDPMGTEAEVNTAADADGGCTAQEEKCIEDARQAAIRAINMNPDMFGRVVCPTGRSSCDSPELADCIRSGLENGNFACADRGTGGCHKGEKNSGHTDTPCGKLKSDSAKGTVDGKPDACEPCKHPQEVANNCAACADDVMKQSKTILCRDAPRGGICRNSNLAALLVHEAAHNCVGGHDTTNPDKQPKQQPTATCDKCGRPDAGGIEGGFKPMR